MNDKNEIISNLIDKSEPKRKIIKNVFKSFLIGGTICMIAQVIKLVLMKFVDETLSTTISTIIMIVISSTLTAIGVYDKIGQIGGAGTIVPISGFANTVTSCAMEYKSEGIITGIICNMLKLAGSVIVIGIISAFFTSSVVYLLGIL